MDVLAKMNPTDEFIYVHLLKTGALTALCLLLWVSVVFFGVMTVPPLLRKRSSARKL